MLKTIKEKEKETFVYTDPTLVVGLMGIGIFILGVAVLGVVFEKWSGEVVALAGILIVVDAIVCFLLLKKKQILIVDRTAQTVEEYVSGQQKRFPFAEVEWADVERLKVKSTSEEPATIEFLENPEIPVTHVEPEPSVSRPPLHLNYHLFLHLKNGAGKYFLFDNNGKGMKDYAEAALIVKTINAALNLPKSTLKELNLNTIKPSHKLIWILFMILLLGAGATAYYFVVAGQR